MMALPFFDIHVFGKQPKGERLQRILKSPNYRDGAFQNLSVTPTFTNGANYFTLLKDFFITKHPNQYPNAIIPSVKTDLKLLNAKEDCLIWFGHSSYFMQIDGKKILVDPVLSGAASPFNFSTKAFKGTDIYVPDEFPEIDYLLITHDHYDHLDYRTIRAMKSKVKQVITGLGTGAHLEHWGCSSELIHEMDWYDHLDLKDGFVINSVPARHFSGRTFKRNQTLWTSFVLETPHFKIFIGGDSGFDTHFEKIGNDFGPFDLAILENGQYNKSWQNIHTMPNEFFSVAQALKVKRILPVHSSKFVLGLHPWYEPLQSITENNQQALLNISTPMIGEKLNLNQPNQLFNKWWEALM